MYANQYGPVSNNPFVEDPSTAHARFPDLNTSSFQSASGYPQNGYPNQPQQQYQQYPSQPYAPGGQHQAHPQAMSPQGQFASTSYAPQYPPQGQMGPQPTGIGSFQPSPSFTQQLPQQYPIPSGYPYSGGSYPPHTTNPSPSYLAEFDPYGQLAQTQTQAQSQSQPHAGQGASGTGPPGVAHPRDLIRIHKSGLEAWDTYSWKQLFWACDALKEAWSTRKQQAESIVRQYGPIDPGLFGPNPSFGYNSQVEGWKQVLKDASDHFDTVAASTFQLHEVFNSYRQSGDAASKRRVRESCNAAVRGLPDWPTN